MFEYQTKVDARKMFLKVYVTMFMTIIISEFIKQLLTNEDLHFFLQ